MRTVDVDLNTYDAIQLGRRGENLAVQVRFDFSEWVSVYGGGGSPALLVLRNGDTAPYPVTFSVAESTLLWDVSSTDTDVSGAGLCELQYILGNTIVKSQRFVFNVLPSLDEAGDAPEPLENLLEQITILAAQAVQAAQNAQSAAESASSSAESAENSAESASESEGKVRSMVFSLDENGDLILSSDL